MTVTRAVTSADSYEDLSVWSQQVQAQTLLQMHQKKLIDKSTVAKAVVKLRLDPLLMAREFGYETINEFLQEFVQEQDTSSDTGSSSELWTFDAMAQASDARFKRGWSYRQIAEELNRTPKSVQSFFRRTFDQGNSVQRAVWELLNDGYSVQEITELVDYGEWRVQFAYDLLKLKRYCAAMQLQEIGNYKSPVIFLKD